VDVPGGVKKIVLSNPTVADARPSDDGASVLVTGLSVGSGEVRIMRVTGEDLVYKVAVVADLEGMAKQVRELLSNVEGIKITVVGGRVVLDGNLLTKSDYDRVKGVEAAYAGTILNLATLDRKDMNNLVAGAIKRDIGIDSVEVRVIGETATLEGVVYDEADAKRAVELAKLRVPTVVNLLRLEEIMIETDVYFVQVDSTKSEDMGYNILKTLGVEAEMSMSGGTEQDRVGAYSAKAGISARLNALVGSGAAKILAQPHLSTKSGGEGKFHSGGEEIFKVSGVNAGSLEKIPYGVLMKVKPTLRGRERIMSEVTIEVSVPSAGTQGSAFALDKFETTSMAMCKVGESIVISGLAQTLENRFKENTPFLGKIPIFNLFFAEKKELRKNRELVVLLTPKPVFPAPDTRPALSEEKKRLIGQ
jgi:pilus assembly protein CpaC